MASNFDFLTPEFRELAEPAIKAERLVMGDARAANFYARFALETVVLWLYKHDSSLRMPYDQSLGALSAKPLSSAITKDAPLAASERSLNPDAGNH